jgi:hypothetical protein
MDKLASPLGNRLLLWILVVFALIVPAVWLVNNWSLDAAAAVSLAAAVLLALLALARQEWIWAWSLGLLAFSLTPGLLVLAASLTEGVTSQSLAAWTAPYFAGAIGGLILELIQGRGRLELPSVAAKEPPPAGSPEASRPIEGSAGNESTGGTDEEDDIAAPYGPRIDLGFFARLTLGGVAGAAFMILIRVAVDEVSPSSLPASGTSLETLAWAALIGAVSPAVWKAGQALVNARMGSLTEKVQASGEVLDEAEAVVKDAAVAEESAVVGEIRVEDLASQLTQAPDSDVVMGLLQDQVMSRVRPRAQIQMQLGEALGMIRAAKRVLRRRDR